MSTINKLIIVLFLILNFGSSSFAENNFFEEGKINTMKKNMKNLNFCFKEVLFLTQRIKIHICI